MALSEDFLQELRSRNDITSVISGYVQLRRRGRNEVGLCPFHGEKTPSFTVYPDTESFYCFGCGIGGDVINFIRHAENLDYFDAVRLLAQRAGMDMPQDDSFDDSMRTLRMRIYEANREAARFFYSKLNSPEGKRGLDYLHNRCLSDRTIRTFGLGFAPDSWSSLSDYLIKEKGFKPSELIEANLAFKNKKGGLTDRFRNRVMFPIIDLRGNVVAFGGRIMTDEKPKYLNTSDTPAFKKSYNLFALNKAKNSKSDKIILCEGYMDVIAIHQAGFDFAVATLGTALTPEQARIIKKYTNNVIICYDADEAGQKATARAIEILRKENLNIQVLTVPDGKDPDEFIRKHGENGHIRFKMLIEGTGTDIEYRLKKLKDSFETDTADGQVQYMNEAAKVIAAIENPVERNIYAGRVCEEFSVTKTEFERLIDSIIKKNSRRDKRREFDKIKNNLAVPTSNSAAAARGRKTRAQKAEEFVITYLMNNPDAVKAVSKKLEPTKVSEGLNRRLYETIISRYENGRDVSYTGISPEFTMEENSLIVAMISVYSPGLYTYDACMECVQTILNDSALLSAKELSAKSDEDVQAYLEAKKNKLKNKKPQ